MNKKNNIWSIIFKILTILMFCFLIFLICYDYFDVENTYISTEIIVALIIALVIVCIDSFDSFQIGNLLNMKKEKKLIEKENKNLKEQNLNLMNLITNINNNISINIAEVKPATDTDKKTKSDVENLQEENEKSSSNTTSKLEFETLNKYIKMKHYDDATIIRDAKVDLSNPFMKESLIFDLYIKQDNIEEFVEIKYLVPSMYNYFYIYKQLSLIGYYNQVNHANAKYVLIITAKTINAENKIAKLNKQKYEHLLEIFKSPIEKGLMSIQSL